MHLRAKFTGAFCLAVDQPEWPEMAALLSVLRAQEMIAGDGDQVSKLRAIQQLDVNI